MKYAIFDLDGTVVDSMKYWRNFGRYYLIEKGYNPGENELERIESVNWAKGICDYFYEHYHFTLTPEELYTWGMDFMKRKYSNDIKFKPGAVDLLEKLHNSGVKMCICSSTDYRLMEPALERLDIAKYFDFTVHCREYGKEKDDPEIFLYCMERLGAKNPGEVAVFEDAYYSRSTAKSAGFYVVGMFDETEKNQDKMQAISDQYVTDYSQLDFSKLPR